MNKLMYTYEADAKILNNKRDNFFASRVYWCQITLPEKYALIMGNMLTASC